MIRRLNLLLLGVLAVAITACATPHVEECGATGVFCPSGTHCAAAQGICLPDTNTCGDAHMDPGEVCDDGNTNDGDGCSRDCTSDETCGNSIVDSRAKIAEQCDHGANNGKAGDTCSATCQNVVCGNGHIEQGEECDDGNTDAGDGCSAKCVLERCGNGITDPGEACDKPGDLAHCSADCKSTLECGNGKVDPGEECDNGGANANDADCRLDCVVNRCGDGFLNTQGSPGHTEHIEHCETTVQAGEFSRAVTPVESTTCNDDCSIPSCGDGKVNRHFTAPGGTHPEQCDNIAIDGTSLNSNDADCTASCEINVCGDNHQNLTVGHREDCDDGNRVDTDACTNQCKVSGCGDGIVGPNEDCDDGPGNNGVNKRCNASCKFNVCGDHDKSPSEQCDEGNAGTPKDTLACDLDCTFPVCGDGHLNTLAGEACDHGAANGTTNDTCSVTCHLVGCGNGFVEQGEDCDDGPGNNGPHKRCNASCKLNVCGDGDGLTGVEQCDDGVAGTKKDSIACDSDCTFAVCGDNHLNTLAGETCDHGSANGASGDSCSLTCQTVACGNGVIEGGEVCDDANTTCGTCSANCKAVTSVAVATGLIAAAPGTNMTAADTFILDDGASAPVTFHFFKTTATLPNSIRADDAQTSANMASNIASAINTSGSTIKAVPILLTNIVLLTNRVPGTPGNNPITEGVTTTNFGVSGMSGGQAGDCALTTNCRSDGDCESNRCLSGKCRACASGDDCVSNLCLGGQCARCQSNADCPGQCDTVSGTCTDSCVHDNDCASNLCVTGTCTSCVHNSDCDSNLCIVGVCTACVLDNDCTTNLCVTGTCKTCTVNADCTSNVCKSDHTCQ